LFFSELISEWNNLTAQTVTIYNELLLDEISSVANGYFNDVEFHRKMLTDTLTEQYERKRRKYLTKKYFSLWLDNSLHAKEERFILNEVQMKYHFLNNEEFLCEELHSLVVESNEELNLRELLLENALKKQFQLKREHYLQLKYFSLWIFKFRQRKKLIKQQLALNNNNKRTNTYLQLRSNKKLKENNQQYHTIKSTFDQLTTDLNQIQLFIDKLSS
jgi:hypothetical protein